MPGLVLPGPTLRERGAMNQCPAERRMKSGHMERCNRPKQHDDSHRGSWTGKRWFSEPQRPLDYDVDVELGIKQPDPEPDRMKCHD